MSLGMQARHCCCTVADKCKTRVLLLSSPKHPDPCVSLPNPLPCSVIFLSTKGYTACDLLFRASAPAQ